MTVTESQKHDKTAESVLLTYIKTVTDLPLILILSVYTDFSRLAKYRFSSSKFGKIQIFSGMRNVFLYIFFSHTDFFHRILIFFVIYTDFVLDQSGRSAVTGPWIVWLLGIFFFNLHIKGEKIIQHHTTIITSVRLLLLMSNAEISHFTIGCHSWENWSHFFWCSQYW